MFLTQWGKRQVNFCKEKRKGQDLGYEAMPGMGELDRGATFLRRIAEALREKKGKE